MTITYEKQKYALQENELPEGFFSQSIQFHGDRVLRLEYYDSHEYALQRAESLQQSINPVCLKGNSTLSYDDQVLRWPNETWRVSVWMPLVPS
jgi:hypothetical protein